MSGGDLFEVGGVDLYVTASGAGPAIVFVHGGLTDHQAWRFVEPELVDHHHVVTYDRRGHSGSSATPVATRRRDEEDDLIALIEVLDVGPVHLVGSSYGASIVLGAASRRPDLVRGVVAHEPALLDVATGPVIEEARHRLHDIGRQLAAGDVDQGVERFVDELILGPGWWAKLPDLTRSTMLANAATIPAMLADPAWAGLDTGPLASSGIPVLVTGGSVSPAWLRAIGIALVEVIPSARAHTYQGAGHMPHVTHPAELIAVVRESVAQATSAGAGRPGPA